METHALTDTKPCTVANLIEQSRQNPVRWIVNDILIEGGSHVLSGKEETFKTMLTIQLCESLATQEPFLGKLVERPMTTGIVELEEKPRLFGHRLGKFFQNGVPEIHVLPDDLRLSVLNHPKPKDRIGVVADWAESHGLDFVAIDSAVKLFPPGYDLSRPDLASEVFSQLQRLPTSWVLAHFRKSQPGEKALVTNDEIVGSGRFAQDPDMIHHLVRPHARSPMCEFRCGKSREGEKPAPLKLWFDKVDFRLYPINPLVHLLRTGPKLEDELVAEGKRRFGEPCRGKRNRGESRSERWVRERIKELLALTDEEGNPAVETRMKGHEKQIVLIGEPVQPESEFEGEGE